MSNSNRDINDMEGMENQNGNGQSIRGLDESGASSPNASQGLVSSGPHVHYHFHLDNSEVSRAVMTSFLQQSGSAHVFPDTPTQWPSAVMAQSSTSLPCMPALNSLIHVTPQPSPQPTKRGRGRPTTESKIKEAIEAALKAQSHLQMTGSGAHILASTAVQQPVTQVVAGPSSAVQHSYAVAGPSSSGPLYAVAGPSNKGLSSTIAGPPQFRVRVCKVCGLGAADHYLINCGHQVHKSCMEPRIRANPICPVNSCGASCTLEQLRKMRMD